MEDAVEPHPVQAIERSLEDARELHLDQHAAELERRLGEVAARIAGEVAADARTTARTELIERLERRTADLERVIDERAAEFARAAGEAEAGLRAAVERAQAEAAGLEEHAGRLEAGLRAAVADAHEEAERRFNAAAESVSASILAAGRAQEREAKIRRSARGAEKGLKELRERIAAADALLDERPS